MVTGETEHIINKQLGEDAYDDFIFGNKKKRRARRTARNRRRLLRKSTLQTNTGKARRIAKRTERRSAPKRIDKRAKRKTFFRKLGNTYRNIGGATAIGSAIDAITTPKLPDQNGNTSVPEDYTFSMGSRESPKPDEKKKAPTIVYVFGGVIVVGVIGLIVANNKKKKQYKQYP